MKWVMYLSVMIGLLIIGAGFTYAPYFAWCEYEDLQGGTKIGRHFTFSPPSKEQALRELKDALPHINVTDHWKEKVAATYTEPMTPLQRHQGISSIFVGSAFIAFPFLYRSRKRKSQNRIAT
ncbi:hypothetical protein KQI65_10165 [bacterium]|nr:hypothetical protein [bacterium]